MTHAGTVVLAALLVWMADAGLAEAQPPQTTAQIEEFFRAVVREKAAAVVVLSFAYLASERARIVVLADEGLR